MKVMMMIFPVSVICGLMACSNVPVTKEIQKPFTLSNNDTLISFNNETVGKQAIGLKGFSNCSQTINWVIAEENGNKALMQQAKNESSCYNLITMQGKSYQNFITSVKIKAVAGEEDQGGGLVWRCQDANNYYLARYNPLENNFRFYKVVNGDRKQLKSVDSNIKSGEWFTMAIEMNGNKIVCSLNGSKLIKTTDDTFSKAGTVGLWTKADAQSFFDDLSIKVAE